MKIEDTGFIPEADRIDRTGNTPMYDYMRSGKVNLEEIVNAADIASLGKVENIEKLKAYLKSDESAVRYWGATGLLILGEKAAPAASELKAALADESADVVATAAEALYNLGEKAAAENALLKVLGNPNEFARCHALNVIDCINDDSREMQDGVIKMVQNAKSTKLKLYDMRAANWLFEKWNLDAADYGIKFE